MLRRLFFPLLLGLAGCAILLSLGTWQVQRLAWKQAILADIDARIHAVPVDLAQADPDQPYLPVRAEGVLTGDYLRVLVSRKQIGPGYRIVASFDTGGRRVLVDLGFLREGAPLPPLGVAARVTGNLHSPQEIDRFTPAPDTGRNIWFARDVPAMAAALGADPVLIVARDPVIPGVEPMPVTVAGIPNDHLNYAITWFLLALVWAGMTGLLIWRIWRTRD